MSNTLLRPIIQLGKAVTVHSVIALFSSVAPLAFGYLIVRYCFFSPLRISSDNHSSMVDISTLPPTPWWLFLAECHLLVEVLFYLQYRWTLGRLQTHRPHPPSTHELTPQRRRQLYDFSLLTITNLRPFISAWFFGSELEDIQYDNFADFFAWAFFLADYETMKAKANVCSEAKSHLQEIDVMIQLSEAKLQYSFQAGRNPNVRCMRLNLDPLTPRHRPFLYYLILQLLTIAFSVYLGRFLGFQKFISHKEQELLGAWFSDAEKQSSRAKLPYWYRPPTRPVDREPIVFVHGIGVGLFGYVHTIRKLVLAAVSEDGQSRGVFALELPHVSSLLFPLFNNVAEDVPTMHEAVDAIQQMLKRHQDTTKHTKATFAGHSMGTAVATWVVKERPDLVERLVLIDPICFMLHLPDLAHNFIYRHPSNWVEWLLWYFASRELYINWSLGRCFYWYQNALYIEEIPKGLKVEVILGGCDSLVPGTAIHDYLLEKGKASLFLPDDRTGEQQYNHQPSSDLVLHYYPMRNHAEFLFDPLFEDKVVRVMLEETHVASAGVRNREPSTVKGDSEMKQQRISTIDPATHLSYSAGSVGNGMDDKADPMKAPWLRSRSSLFRNKNGYMVETTMEQQRGTIFA